MEVLNDAVYMRLALELARGAAGQTGINPAVGCVVVKDGRIVGTGAHLQRGKAHAEVHALNMAGAEAEGATAYVTLEPCSHYGRTPPCSERLIAEKVKRVVAAAVDPNPLVAGRGIAKLREAGIDVSSGLLAAEADELNEAYRKYILTKLPFITLKTACTLDGKIAAKTGDSKWISGELSREYVHTLRHRNQGIMVGVGTVLADNPQLSARLSVPALQPVRIVIDSSLRTPPDARMFEPGAKVLLITTEQADERRRKALEAAGAEILAAGRGPRVDLREAMRLLGEREIGSILLEGGGRLNGAMLEARLIDKFVLFFAPKIIGGDASPSNFAFPGMERMHDAYMLTRLKAETVGEDVMLTAYPSGRKHGNEEE